MLSPPNDMAFLMADRTDSHNSAVAPTVVGLALFGPCPLVKKSAISGIGITIIGFQQWHIISVGQDRIGEGYGENAVISERRGGTEKLKSLYLDIVPFADRADYVSSQCTDHEIAFSSYFN